MRRGFTLIELLVVIAIIAILAAILFPVFARAREKARQTTCLNNVKQLALGLLMYAQDYDERFPHGYVYGTGPEAGGWYTFIGPYIKNTQILICPSQNVTVTCSYGVSYNNMFTDTTSGPRGCKLGAIDAPAEALLLGETATAAGGSTWYYYSPKRYPYPYDVAPYNRIPNPGRHNDGSNVAFADGHAKWVASQTMISNSWSGWTAQPASAVQ